MINGYNLQTGIQSCKGCIFEDVHSECSVYRLEKFEKVGAKVHKGVDGHYHINRKCNLYRDKEWREKYFRETQEKAGENITTYFNAKRAALEESQVQVTVAIDATNNNKEFFLDDLLDTLTSIAEQDLECNLIVIVTKNLTEKQLFQLGEDIRSCIALKNPWKITNITVGAANQDPWDNAFQKSIGHYICFVESGIKLSPDLISKLERAYNELLEQNVLIRGTNYVMINRAVYDAVGQNSGYDPEGELPDGVVARIEYLAKRENNERLLQDWK